MCGSSECGRWGMWDPKNLILFFFKLGALQCITTSENTKTLLNIYHYQFFKTFSSLFVCVLKYLVFSIMKTQDYNYELKIGLLLMICVVNHMGIL